MTNGILFLGLHLFYTLIGVCDAFKPQGFSLASSHIDVGSEVTLPQPSLKDFQDVLYTMRGPLPMTYPAGRESNIALLCCNVAARLHEIHSF